MEIILSKNVESLGKVGDVVKVKDGFARNYLLPHKLGVVASSGNIKRVEQSKAKLEAERDMLTAAIPQVVVSEATQPEPTRVLPRGNFLDESGPVVDPAVPPFLGTPPSGPPPQDPMGRAIGKMFGTGQPPVSDMPSELRGSAGSPGKVTGCHTPLPA